MATSIHIPKAILDKVDRRARKLNLSRSRFILRALERELEREQGWSEGFFEKLRDTDRRDDAAVDEMMEAIRANRSSKEGPCL